MKRFPAITWKSAKRAGRDHQRLLPFLERTQRRFRLFKRTIAASTALLIVATIEFSAAGRYHARIWTDRAHDVVRYNLLGLEQDREQVEANWHLRREHGIEQTHQRLSSFYRDTDEATRELFRVAGMDPDHALIRYGRGDAGFVISPQVFERDDRGRSYRLRPGTRSVWLRQITLHDGPFGLFQVLDTPAHRAAAARAGAIVDEGSVQRTNSWGLRGPEPDLSAPARGIVLGDSFMQGMFNGEEDTPSRRLERRLEAAWKLPVTVVNTGHIGYSPEQYYYTLAEYGERVKPQFVVVSVCPNDFGEGMEVLRGRGDWFDEAGYWLGEIRRWCLGHQAICLMVPVPTNVQVEGIRDDEYYPGRICRIFRTISIRYCDPLNDFTDEYLRLRRIAEIEGHPSNRCALYNYPIEDDHFSPAGAELWADVVSRRLALLLDPPMSGPQEGRSLGNH